MFELRPLACAVAKQVGGGTPSRQVAAYWNGSIPWASVKDFADGGSTLHYTQENITAAGLRASASNLIPAGTPLVCTRMAVGRSASAPMPVAINQDVKAVSPANGTSSAYLLRLLQFVQPRAEAAAVGSTVKGIRIGDYLLIAVPMAPHEEQGRIADILDTLDTTIRQTEAIIEKLKQVKQGLLHDLLTRGIDANGELRPPQSQAPHLYEDSRLGWIPREWEAKALTELVDQRRPIVYGILMPGQRHEGGVPVVKVKDIVGGSILLDQLLLTSPAIDLEYKRSRLKPGDLLFTIRGSVGRTAFVPAQLEDANITQDTARIGIAGVDARFVREYLAMPSPVRFIATHTLGVAVQGINLRDVRRIPIAVPRPDEATEIADRLDAINDRVTAETLEVEKLALTKAGLMDDLLTGRVRVTPLLD